MIENWWPTQIGYYDNPNHVDISSHCLDIKSKIKDNQTLMVGHIFLYNDRVKKIKELLPHIGKILHIESNRLNWGRYQKKN